MFYLKLIGLFSLFVFTAGLNVYVYQNNSLDTQQSAPTIQITEQPTSIEDQHSKLLENMPVFPL